MSCLEVLVLHEASSRNFGVRSTQLRVSVLSRNKTGIFGDGIGLKWHRFLIAHVVIAGPVHVVV